MTSFLTAVVVLEKPWIEGISLPLLIHTTCDTGKLKMVQLTSNLLSFCLLYSLWGIITNARNIFINITMSHAAAF